MPRVALAFLAAAVGLVVPRLLPAVTAAADLCAPSDDPCVVNTALTVDPGAVFDLGSRALDVKSHGVLNVGGGSMTILAGSVRIEPGGTLVGRGGAAGGTIVVTAIGGIRLEAAGATVGRIDVSADSVAGIVTLTAGGDVALDGAIVAKATATAGSGGTVTISAGGAVPITGTVALAGASQGTGGSLLVQATGAITVGQPIDASGGSGGGGSIDLESGTADVVVNGKLDVSAGGSSGDGGSVTLIAGGSVAVNAQVAGAATGTLADGGGTGADLTISAQQNVTVGGQCTLTGAAPDGSGGSAEIDAGADVTFTQPLLMKGGGADTYGGDATISAGHDLMLGALDVSGGTTGGGTATLFATGAATLPAELNADGTGASTVAGVVSIEAGTLLVSGAVHASGPSNGSGGFVNLQACGLTVAPSGQVLARGADGQTLLQASGLATVAGALTSGPPGLNEIQYRDPALPPVLTGTITPAAVLEPTPDLPPCTAVCGNGVTDPGEECDDGNTRACDGCSPGCRREGCGNGVVECGEQCDDGPANGPGDRCDATCHLAFAMPLIPAARTGRASCFVEWGVQNPNAPITSGFPSSTQTCIDGDPSCDADGLNDGGCTFTTTACLHVTDARLPLCNPPAITDVKLNRPDALRPADAIDAANAALLVPALAALGVTVKDGTNILRVGAPDPQADHCTVPVGLRVPHASGSTGRRTLILGAGDTTGRRLGANRLHLVCAPNSAVCGNGRVELGEECDDGNTTSCDGCSASCRRERCGDGVVQCGEQCDAGALNGTPGSTCSVTCTETPPALRIPGGGPSASDCALEWSLALAAPALDHSGRPSTTQTCTEGDPACDFDPTAGRCRFHLWACLGGADPLLACAAGAVASVDLKRPSASEKGPGPAARQVLLGALGGLGFPVGPGERCTRRMDVDVPAGRAKLTIHTLARRTGASSDSDTVKLVCAAPPR
jgi:cysteine-rich repeat protein